MTPLLTSAQAILTTLLNVVMKLNIPLIIIIGAYIFITILIEFVDTRHEETVQQNESLSTINRIQCCCNCGSADNEDAIVNHDDNHGIEIITDCIGGMDNVVNNNDTKDSDIRVIEHLNNVCEGEVELSR